LINHHSSVTANGHQKSKRLATGEESWKHGTRMSCTGNAMQIVTIMLVQCHNCAECHNAPTHRGMARLSWHMYQQLQRHNCGNQIHHNKACIARQQLMCQPSNLVQHETLTNVLNS